MGAGLVAKLEEAGYRVRVLVRRPPAPNLFRTAVEVALGDITDQEAVRSAAQGVELVFHLAAKLHINNPDPALREEYHRVNVEGTRIVTRAAVDAGVRRLVFFSTIAVYGATRPGEVLNEDSPTQTDSLYGESKRAAEAIVLASRRSDGEPLGVVLRVAGIYGPRIKGNYRQLVRWIRRGWFIPVGSGHNRRTLVYHFDVAAAAVLAAEHPNAAGGIFNVTDGTIHTFREIVDAIARAMGRTPSRWYIPEWPVRLAAGLCDRVLILGGQSASVGPMVSKMLEDMAVSGQKIQDVLGFHPSFDLRAGWTETIPRLVEK